MNKQHYWKRILALTCAILIICSLMGVFLSHSHECTGNDCIICTFIEFFKNIVAIASSGFIALNFIDFTYKRLYLSGRFIPIRTGTLVLQKVKLLN